MTITSAGEASIVRSVVGTSGPWFVASPAWDSYSGPWLGGYQDDGGAWHWITGELWSFTAWCANQPSGNACAEAERFLHVKVGGYCDETRWWGDLTASGNCIPELSGLTGMLVEFDADCNNDGIVDYGQCRDGSLPDYNGNNIPDCCEQGAPCVVGSYPVQWRVSEGGNGHWYRRNVDGSIPSCWDVARQRCLSAGGDLASITSAAEVTFALTSYCDAPSTSLGWIGYQGTGIWSDGEPVTYVNWFPGQPSGDGPFVTLNCEGWNDIGGPSDCWVGSCVWLAEWSADCNADGIVDYGQILQGQLADANANGVPDTCESPTCADADLFPTGTVNGADLGALLSQWGEAPAGTASDLNRDGAVDGTDLGILLAFWGPCPN